MSHDWNSTVLESQEKVLDELAKLQGDRWLSRGQSMCYDNLMPTIDRDNLGNLSRAAKLRRERESIDRFRSAARFFAPGEERALVDNIIQKSSHPKPLTRAPHFASDSAHAVYPFV